MAKSKGKGGKGSDRKTRKSSFRGQEIQITVGAKQSVLRAAGLEVMYQDVDDGVYAHKVPYKVYGSPEEMGEDLIRQIGQAEIVAETPKR